jgi:hypothetical protein
VLFDFLAANNQNYNATSKIVKYKSIKRRYGQQAEKPASRLTDSLWFMDVTW